MSDACVLHCPSCGAPVDPKASSCPHCAAPLSPARCPWCFEWTYVERDCPRCGASARPADPDASPLSCPTCRRGPLISRVLEGACLSGCGLCGGVWADAESFKRICADRGTHTAYLGEGAVTAAPNLANPASSPVLYRPCARCGLLMNRVNFASCSGVILDVCKRHGVWFDTDELRQIVAFIRGGGLDMARQREIERLAEERKRVEQAAAEHPGAPVAACHIVAARSLLSIFIERD